MAITAAKLEVVVDADTKGMVRGLDKADRRVGTLGDRLKRGMVTVAKWGAVAAGAGAAFAGAFAVRAVSAASDLNETLSKTQQVFGSATSQVTGFADHMAEAFGAPKQDILDAASNIGLVAKASGLSQEAAAGMSTEMAQLAADASSFFNVPLPEALEKIRSGLVGEAEPLRSFGVLLSAAAVQSKAVEMGIASAGEELTEQQKVMARSAIITEQMSDASGDLERTQGSMANRVKALKGRFENFTAELGQKLLPVAEQLLEWAGKHAPGAMAAAENAVDTLLALFEDFGDWISDNRKTLEKYGEVVADVAKTGFKVLGETVSFAKKNFDLLLPAAVALLVTIKAYAVIQTVVGLYRSWQAATAAQTTAQWLLNSALLANPIGLVIALVAGLVAGFIVAYKTSERFRNIVGRAFEAVMDGAKRLAANVVGGFRMLMDAVLAWAETTIGAAAEAFGWVPGVGDKLKDAHRSIKEFRAKANEELSRLQTNVRYSADVSPAMRELARLRDAMRQIPGAATVQYGGTRGGLVPGAAHGGLVPARPGGTLVNVGEGGEDELIIPLSKLGGGATGGDMNITIHGFVGNEKQLADEISEMLRRREMAMR